MITYSGLIQVLFGCVQIKQQMFPFLRAAVTMDCSLLLWIATLMKCNWLQPYGQCMSGLCNPCLCDIKNKQDGWNVEPLFSPSPCFSTFIFLLLLFGSPNHFTSFNKDSKFLAGISSQKDGKWWNRVIHYRTVKWKEGWGGASLCCIRCKIEWS